MPGPVDETRCGDTSEAQHAIHSGKIESLRAALKSLPPNEREVFLLRQKWRPGLRRDCTSAPMLP
jgi:DNA-directed RNA polymerase specialized sigma24 family protein